jgi:hypothetical protein
MVRYFPNMDDIHTIPDPSNWELLWRLSSASW